MKLHVINLGKVSLTVDEQPWSINKAYDRLVVTYDIATKTSYISRRPVPKNDITLDNRKYWVPIGSREAVTVASYKILANEAALPQTEAEVKNTYLIGEYIYVWVGEDGNAVNGKYKKLELRGEQGIPGKSALEVINEGLEEPIESIDDFIQFLKGDPGEPGASAYEYAKAHAAELGLKENLTPQEWYDSLKGNTGDPGLSAFQIAQAASEDELTLEAWLLSLKGSDGKSAYDVAMEVRESQGYTDTMSKADWIASLKGKSAYDVYADNERANNRTPLNKTNWLASLKGSDGKSAYTSYTEWAAANNQTVMTEEAWIETIMTNHSGGGGTAAASAYIRDNQIRIPIRGTSAPAVLYSPEPNYVINLSDITPAVDLNVRGNNLHNDVVLVRLDERISFGVQRKDIVLSKADVCSDTGVTIKVGLLVRDVDILSTSITLKTNNELPDRSIIINYQRQGYSPNTPDVNELDPTE